MKEILTFIKDVGIKPFFETIGFFTTVLFILSLIPSMSFIPKFVLLFILTH